MKENINNKRIKMKKSLALSKSTAVPNKKQTSNSNMPNQYARVKNVTEGEDVISLINFLKKK
jgi:hypothetical protein